MNKTKAAVIIVAGTAAATGTALKVKARKNANPPAQAKRLRRRPKTTKS